MKKIFIFAMLLFCFALMLCGCDKEEPSESLPQSSSVAQVQKTPAPTQSNEGNEKPEDWDKVISHAEFVEMAWQQAFETEQADYMQQALDLGWYDWDEIPPTGEKYDELIPKQLAAKIAINVFYPDAKGEYGDWADKITDFSSLDGRYYEVVFAALEEEIIALDENGALNPRAEINKWEAMQMLGIEKDDKGALATPTPAPTAQPTPTAEAQAGGVQENGALQLVGTQLCNQNGDAIILRGMSSHGMQWYADFAGEGAIKTTKEYGANAFRVAMYTAEGGYISNRAVEEKVIEAVDAAISLDMYVIIDWHILHDNNPNTYKTEAAEFFARMAERYANSPAVIYEICNEPNGGVTWEQDIYPYAEEIIPVIREKSPNSIVLVGTGTWSQDVQDVAAKPLEFENVMYTCHFYSGTHGKNLQDNIDAALAAGTPVFVSEWGTSRADGSGGVYIDEAEQWLEFLEERGISWLNWSLCDKNETSAALRPGASPSGGWQEDDLSESGKFVFSRLPR